MAKLKVITVNQSVFAENDAIAAETREALRKKGLLFLNVMASPGAGKTTLLLATIRALKDECRIGVMEADIEATVDAKNRGRGCTSHPGSYRRRVRDGCGDDARSSCRHRHGGA